MRDPIQDFNQLRAAGNKECMLLAYADDVGPEIECIKHAGSAVMLVHYLGTRCVPILLIADCEGFDWATPGGGHA